MLVGIGRMAEILGVAVGTLRRWDRENRFRPDSWTSGGHRRYDPTRRVDGTKASEPSDRPTVAYARVSCWDRKSDLERQKARLSEYCARHGWDRAIVIDDVGSGMNFRKRGLKRLISLIMAGSIGRIVVENRDRLLRFGSELLFDICRRMGIEVVVVQDDAAIAFEKELARDVLEIVTVFSARLHGRRSAERRTGRSSPSG